MLLLRRVKARDDALELGAACAVHRMPNPDFRGAAWDREQRQYQQRDAQHAAASI
jgi:hypothetical protein